jgi:phage terminase Nu1 subunit (DNA packaging protein)
MKLNPDSEGMLVNKKELAQIFGISERTFSEYQKDPDFPIVESGTRGESNQYDTAQITRFLISRAEEKVRSRQSALVEAKTSQALSDAALKRLQVNEKLGEVVHKEEAFLILSDWARFANQQFKESFDRMILDLQSTHNIEVSKDDRAKYITTTSERVRGYALKLGGRSAESIGAVSHAQEVID